MYEDTSCQLQNNYYILISKSIKKFKPTSPYFEFYFLFAATKFIWTISRQTKKMYFKLNSIFFVIFRVSLWSRGQSQMKSSSVITLGKFDLRQGPIFIPLNVPLSPWHFWESPNWSENHSRNVENPKLVNDLWTLSIFKIVELMFDSFILSFEPKDLFFVSTEFLLFKYEFYF